MSSSHSHRVLSPRSAAIAAGSPADATAGGGDARPARVVAARGLALHASRGVVYGPVDLEVRAGELAVVQGPQGAGRSSLLLTLAGRMVPDRGAELTVLGHRLPGERRAVQRRSAIAGFRGIDDLDESVTVRDTVRERLGWLSPWYRPVPRVTDELFATYAATVFGDRPLPVLDTLVWDLDEVDVMLLRVTLAMAQRPELLLVDDIDQVHDTARRQLVWDRLEALTEHGVTVVTSVASLDEVARVTWRTPPRQVFLATGPHALHAA